MSHARGSSVASLCILTLTDVLIMLQSALMLKKQAMVPRCELKFRFISSVAYSYTQTHLTVDKCKDTKLQDR